MSNGRRKAENSGDRRQESGVRKGRIKCVPCRFAWGTLSTVNGKTDPKARASHRRERRGPQTKCPDQRDGVENQTLIWGRIKVTNNPKPFHHREHREEQIELCLG